VTRGGSTRSSRAGAVGFAAVAVFAGEVDEAAVADLEAGVGAAVQHAAVAFIGLPGFEAHHRGVGLRPQDDVDHAGNRIGAVLRRGAVAQHFDAVDRGHRDRVDVGTRGTAADGLLHVDQRLLVAALAVDQHEDLVGAEGAQRRGAQDVGAVADEGAGEIEARLEHLQDLTHFLHAGLAQLFAGDHVDRRGGFRRRAPACARADDLHLVEFGRGARGLRFLVGCLGTGGGVLRLCRQGERQSEGQCGPLQGLPMFHPHARSPFTKRVSATSGRLGA
jgi:hypothetical protein